MSLSPSSFELMARAHGLSAAFNARVRSAVAALPGNPGRVSVRRFGAMWATRCQLPDPPAWMNLMGPVGIADLGSLGEALEWYGDLRPWIEVTPQPSHETVARELARRGAVATHPLDILRGAVPPIDAALPPDVEVSHIGSDDALVFARTLLAGHGDTFWDHEAEGLASLVGSDGMTCYLARIEGEPAAGAIQTYDDGLAYLANASTLPAFRNRGCHKALLTTRLHEAARAGYDEVIALAAVGSTSHRNMERAGLHTLVTLTQWTF